jgi:hypothetical protein
VGAKLGKYGFGTIARLGITGGLAKPEVDPGGVEAAGGTAKAICVASHRLVELDAVEGLAGEQAQVESGSAAEGVAHGKQSDGRGGRIQSLGQPSQQREAAFHRRWVDIQPVGGPAQDIGPLEQVDRADVVLDRIAAQAEAALEMVDRTIGVAAAAGGVRRS